jgi:hypothetical protein
LEVTLRLRHLLPLRTEIREAYEPSENLRSSQAVKLTAPNRSTQCTKGSLYSESSLEANNQPFYKRFQLVYLDVSSAGDQAQCPEHETNV